MKCVVNPTSTVLCFLQQTSGRKASSVDPPKAGNWPEQHGAPTGRQAKDESEQGEILIGQPKEKTVTERHGNHPPVELLSVPTSHPGDAPVSGRAQQIRWDKQDE